VSLVNPYLELFYSLPAACRRDATQSHHPAVELYLSDWMAFKLAVGRHFAWAVPTEEAIAAIRRHATSVLEIGAGSGYWAWLMRQAGILVDAVDVDPPAFTWSDVRRGDEHTAHAHPDKALLLCWPPWASPMAENALVAYGGERVVYIGEWFGGSANPKFFTLLMCWFECVDYIRIPQWYMRNDTLLIFRRHRR
jgi:hypothetical protein